MTFSFYLVSNIFRGLKKLGLYHAETDQNWSNNSLSLVL